MASPRKSQWQTLQRFADNPAFSEVPKFIRQLQNSPSTQRVVQRGIQIGMDVLAGGSKSPGAITSGRPVTRSSVPTAQRARKLVYGPDLDDRADPGEIVWAPKPAVFGRFCVFSR